MVLLQLSIKAELENIASLEPADPATFDYFFEVKCTSCNEKHPKVISLNRAEEFEVAGGKGAKANFVWRCTFCKRESSAKFDSSYPTRAYTEEDSGQFAPLLKVECRGLEFVGFEPRDPWKAASPKGTKFDDIDLSEDMWTEYDEKAGAPVSISEFEWKWARA